VNRDLGIGLIVLTIANTVVEPNAGSIGAARGRAFETKSALLLESINSIIYRELGNIPCCCMAERNREENARFCPANARTIISIRANSLFIADRASSRSHKVRARLLNNRTEVAKATATLLELDSRSARRDACDYRSHNANNGIAMPRNSRFRHVTNARTLARVAPRRIREMNT